MKIITAIMALAMAAVSTIHGASGSFYGDLNAKDMSGNEEVLYQFRSDDNEVWWLLTENEVGRVPKEGDRYVLVYDDKGTTSCRHGDDCECYLYDDELITVIRITGKEKR